MTLFAEMVAILKRLPRSGDGRRAVFYMHRETHNRLFLIVYRLEIVRALKRRLRARLRLPTVPRPGAWLP